MYKAIEIEEYQLQDLIDGKCLINKYDMSIKSLIEINNIWKIFAFDNIEELGRKGCVKITKSPRTGTFLEYVKQKHDLISSDTSISIKDYPDLIDYISFDEWLDCGNRYEFLNDRKVILLLKI